MSKLSNLHVTKGTHIKGMVSLSTYKSYLKQDDIALRISVPDNETVEFDELIISNCGLPIRHDSGKLVIKTLVATDFTADLFNSVGNLTIDNLIVEVDGSNYKKSDYRKYHVDALGQFFNLNSKVVKDVTINNIDAIITGRYIQGMMLSEGSNRYTNFSIGRGEVSIQLDYPYAFNANQLDESYINLGDNGILIKDRKKTDSKTTNVIIKRYSKEQDISAYSQNNTIYYA